MQGVDVEPALVGDPLLGLLAHRLDIERAATLEEDVDVVRGELLGADEDLVGHHERKGELVTLEEAALDVEVHRVGHVIDDVLDSRRGFPARLRFVDGELVQLVELLQRGLVHHVDAGKLGDEEIDERGPVRDGSVLLARFRDLRVRLARVGQLLVHLLRGDLGVVQHLDQLHVVQQVTLRVGQPEQQVVLELLDLLLVARHLLDQGLALHL